MQAAGACWYLLGLQRASKCLGEECAVASGCSIKTLACKDPIYYGTSSLLKDKARLAWANNKNARSNCLDSADNFEYGGYKWTIQLVTNDNRLEKILFPLFWGLMTLRFVIFSSVLSFYSVLKSSYFRTGSSGAPCRYDHLIDKSSFHGVCLQPHFFMVKYIARALI